jgi:hypothetical protein
MNDVAADRAEIVDLLALYCHRLDHADHDGWVDLFTPDGRFEVYGRSFDGAAGLLRMAEGAPPGLHLAGVPLIELGGDEATVQQSFLFVDQVTRETRIGWYDDVVVRTPEGWKLQVRRSTFLTPDGPSDRP